jgi:hypothetical protein
VVKLIVNSTGTVGNTQYEGKTPLAFALKKGNPQIIALLQPAPSGD